MRCGTHKKAFTVYPPGHVPYGRQRVAPIAPDGGQIKVAGDEHFFAGTYFDAALDAARHCAWPHEAYDDSLQSRFPTQVRHLKRAALLLGTEPGLDAHLREQTAQILAVPGQLLHDNSALIKKQPGYQNRGTAICNVLDCLAQTTSVFERLVEAGAGLFLWPPPELWDIQMKTLRPSRFRCIRTRASPH
jgi:hypothetical protein